MTVARYAKATHERVCAAARKLLIELRLDVPPVRERPVDDVLEGLAWVEFGVGDLLRLVRLSEELLGVADGLGIGPGTSRVTVAAAAIYAADRLEDGGRFTQAEVEAASRVVETTACKVGAYSRELVQVYEARSVDGSVGDTRSVSGGLLAD